MSDTDQGATIGMEAPKDGATVDETTSHNTVLNSIKQQAEKLLADLKEGEHDALGAARKGLDEFFAFVRQHLATDAADRTNDVPVADQGVDRQPTSIG